MCRNSSELFEEYRELDEKLFQTKKLNMCKLKWQSHLNSFQISLTNLREKTIKKGKNKLEETILTEKKSLMRNADEVEQYSKRNCLVLHCVQENKNENMIFL